MASLGLAQSQLIENISYYPESVTQTDYQKERCKLDVYLPENTENFSTIVWFHGGGIETGSKEIPQVLKNKGFAVIGVNYRLSPQVKAPAYIEDAAAAIAWAKKNISLYGGNPDKIVISGHSAGGYLTMISLLDPQYLEPYKLNINDFAALVPFSGHTITHFTIRKENGIPGEQPVVDHYAPLFHVKKDTPPIHLITGDREMELLGRYEENAYFYRMLKVVGNQNVYLYEMQGYDHGMTYPAFPLLIKITKNL